MAIEAIVRVSFQSDTSANQAVNNALVGHAQNDTGPGPFQRRGTAAFTCNDADDVSVAQSLVNLSQALVDHATSVDFVGITLVRSEGH